MRTLSLAALFGASTALALPASSPSPKISTIVYARDTKSDLNRGIKVPPELRAGERRGKRDQIQADPTYYEFSELTPQVDSSAESSSPLPDQQLNVAATTAKPKDMPVPSATQIKSSTTPIPTKEVKTTASPTTSVSATSSISPTSTMASVPTSSSTSAPAPGSCALLSQVYVDMGGLNWIDQTGWKEFFSASPDDTVPTPASDAGAPVPVCCGWAGVTCKGNVVVSLNMTANGLKGEISEAIFGMQGLQALSLASNKLNGSLPDAFSRLPALKTLDLSNNTLTGTLPTSLAQHAALSTLHLAFNQLSGLAAFTAPLLVNIFINGNVFTGLAIGGQSGVQNLQRVIVNDNQMTGSLPDLSTATGLVLFSVANNSFSGPLFPLTQLTSLIRFDVRNNTLSGPFPSDVSTLTALSHLYLSMNQISGIFPSTPAPPNLIACQILPNDVQGLPSGDVMSDSRSLAYKCLGGGNSDTDNTDAEDQTQRKRDGIAAPPMSELFAAARHAQSEGFNSSEVPVQNRVVTGSASSTNGAVGIVVVLAVIAGSILAL